MNTWHDQSLGTRLELMRDEPAGEVLELETELVGLLLVGN